LGDFWEPIGLGASARGGFSADGVLLVRWASANFDFFRGFFTFLVRFLPVFVPNFALFPSMPCAYLYVHNFRRTRVTLLRQGFGGQGRFGRKNLAFDKETVFEDQGLRRGGTRRPERGKKRQNRRGGAAGILARRAAAKGESRCGKPVARGLGPAHVARPNARGQALALHLINDKQTERRPRGTPRFFRRRGASRRDPGDG